MPGYLDIHRSMRQVATGELSRRDFVKRAAALGFTAPAIASFLAAAPLNAGPALFAQSAAAQETEEGVMGGTLLVALGTDLASLDLMFGSATINRDVMGHVYEYLFTMAEDNTYIPDLAEDMQISEDGTTFTITLRNGVPFHNGKIMTSADVVASLERWKRMTSRGSAILADVTSIEAPDDATVVLTFPTSNGGFLYGIGHYGGLAGIIPAEIVEKHFDANAAEDPDSQITDIADAIGTGPYKITSWVTDSSIDMVRFEEYAARDEPVNGRGGKRTAYADEIKFIPVADPTARLNGLIAGEYHIAYDLPPAQFDQVSSDPALVPIIVKPGSKAVGVFNKQTGPFTNQALRQAALLATDPVEVMLGTIDNDQFFLNTPALAGPEWTAWFTEVGEESYYGRDIERAKQLVAESGYDGSPLRWITTREFDYMYRSALVSQQQWAEAGINVELVVSDWPTVLTNRADPAAYEVFSTGIGFQGDPLGTSAYTTDWPGWTPEGEITRLYGELVVETDPALRSELWVQLQEAFYVEVPYIQFGEIYNFRATRAEIKGFTSASDLRVWNVWIEE